MSTAAVAGVAPRAALVTRLLSALGTGRLRTFLVVVLLVALLDWLIYRKHRRSNAKRV
jgi:uncharacterized membrane protein YdjX (TVP38/TMEM64 family)